MLKHLDLFSGIGGFSLACEWAGIETIGFVEIDKYCQKVLRKHWPNVPIVEDIRDVEKIKEVVANATGEGLPNRRGTSLANSGTEKPESKRCGSSRNRIQNNVGDRRERPESSALLITAGFPCQPFSVAGKREGERDDRYLWPETIAVIEAIKPIWILLENVTGIINLALDTVLSDLEGAGYSYETLIIPACAVNAWHRRDRVWIVANNAMPRRYPLQKREIRTRGDSIVNSNWWAVEPKLGRVAHGIPNRVDRLKCLGNAIVPQVAYEIIKAIKEIDMNLVRVVTSQLEKEVQNDIFKASRTHN